MNESDVLDVLLADLARKQATIDLYSMYYEGDQPLCYIVPALQQQFGDRITQLVINWPRLGADIHEERLDLQGFRFGRETEPDDELWQWWLATDGPAQSQQANLESIICSHAYAIVGPGDADGDPAVMTAEHPSQVTHRVHPKTRRTSSMVLRWDDEDDVKWADLLLPDANITYRLADREWVEDRRDDHELGWVLGVPLVNRPRLRKEFGVSEFHDVVPIANAANKMATDMMISGEFHAMPRRYAFGFKEEDFVDEHGRQLSTWEQVAGRMWATAAKPDEVAVGQFNEADLQNFHNTIKLLAQLASHILALPPDFMSFESSNPPSAESQRAGETRLIKRAERRISTLSPQWVHVARLRYLVEQGQLPPNAWSLEGIWRDPATPTRSQAADAAVKLFSEGIVPLEQTREDLGYSVTQREAMRVMDEQAARRQLAGLSDLGFGPKPGGSGPAVV